MVNATVTRVVATAAALVLVASAFAGGAAAAGAEADVPVADDAPKTTTCLQVYWEQTVGPVTVVYNCGLEAEIDEGWEPGDEIPLSATSSTIPPCGTGSEVSAGPATAGYDPYCQVYAEIDEDWEPGDEIPLSATTSNPNCYDVYREITAGPVTVVMTSSCSGYVEIDEDWSPTDEAEPLDHMGPSDNPVKCFLEADSGVERWACFFGPPGP